MREESSRMGVNALMEKTPDSFLTPSCMWGLSAETPDNEPGRGLSPDRAGTLTLDFQMPELWEIPLCCLQATQSVMFCYSSRNGLRETGVLLPQAKDCLVSPETGESKKRFSPRTFRFQTPGPHFCSFNLRSLWYFVTDGWIDRQI